VLFFCQFFALVIFIIIVNKKLPLSKAKKNTVYKFTEKILGRILIIGIVCSVFFAKCHQKNEHSGIKENTLLKNI
jgi:hypothetical protein